MTSPAVPTEVRAMLADMGLRHPLDISPAERAEGMAQQHEKAARLFRRIGDETNARSADRAASIARNLNR